ncbi:MAG: hypothetical protein ACLUGO_11690 [Mediterraneibacter faecis]
MGESHRLLMVMKTIEIPYTSTEEQQKIGDYLESIDHHITLHQRKPYFWNKFIVIDWEQRKLSEICFNLVKMDSELYAYRHYQCEETGMQF